VKNQDRSKILRGVVGGLDDVLMNVEDCVAASSPAGSGNSGDGGGSATQAASGVTAMESEHCNTGISSGGSAAVGNSGVAFNFVMCNPPFFELNESPADRTGRRHGNVAQCPGAETEMETEGGEVQFVTTMALDSAILRTKITWYTSMLGKQQSLGPLCKKLLKIGVPTLIKTEFKQGRTSRWALAWSYHPYAGPLPAGCVAVVIDAGAGLSGGADGGVGGSSGASGALGRTAVVGGKRGTKKRKRTPDRPPKFKLVEGLVDRADIVAELVAAAARTPGCRAEVLAGQSTMGTSAQALGGGGSGAADLRIVATERGWVGRRRRKRAKLVASRTAAAAATVATTAATAAAATAVAATTATAAAVSDFATSMAPYKVKQELASCGGDAVAATATSRTDDSATSRGSLSAGQPHAPAILLDCFVRVLEAPLPSARTPHEFELVLNGDVGDAESLQQLGTCLAVEIADARDHSKLQSAAGTPHQPTGSNQSMGATAPPVSLLGVSADIPI
jgi:hypothetical protein